MRDDNIIEIENLHTYFYTERKTIRAVDGVSIEIPKGKIVALVGESGCGKSVTGLSMIRLIDSGVGKIVEGKIYYKGQSEVIDIVKASMKEIEGIRGSEIAMIFQEPMTSLNPVFTIGFQIDEIIKINHPKQDRQAIKAKTLDILKQVGLPRVEGIYKSYPNELSGGMRQRVMIAMALVCEPKVIIADEPTTALDVTIQAQILELLKEVKEQFNVSILLITHDFGIVAELADYVVVMYDGKVVEKGSTKDIFSKPKQAYTLELIQSAKWVE